MDDLFATSKYGRSYWGHTCCQLFITNRGFVYVVPIKLKGEVLHEIEQFSKEIDATEATICGAGGEQTSNNIRKFCRDFGTTLKIFE